MTVYIEYVIIDNVIIDYLLLKATFIIVGETYKKIRLIAVAFLGAFIALVYPLIEHVTLISVVVKVLSGILLCLISTSYRSKRSFYVSTIIFFTLTFLTGGTIIGLLNIMGIEHQNEICVAIVFVPAYLVIKSVTSIIKSLYKNKEVRAFVYKVDLVFDKKTVTVSGFLDTGNALFDGESPVIICGKGLFFRLLGDNILSKKLKRISINTVNGKTQNLSFKLDQIVIYLGQSVNINSNVTIALSHNAIGDGYDIILHPALVKGEVNNEDDFKAKKIS